jgi:acyl-CoA reductase-like NAD-dependent aldehyde dehydrogenase
VRTIECGDPKDPNTAMGPVISAKQLAHVMEQVG